VIVTFDVFLQQLSTDCRKANTKVITLTITSGASTGAINQSKVKTSTWKLQ